MNNVLKETDLEIETKLPSQRSISKIYEGLLKLSNSSV